MVALKTVVEIHKAHPGGTQSCFEKHLSVFKQWGKTIELPEGESVRCFRQDIERIVVVQSVVNSTRW